MEVILKPNWNWGHINICDYDHMPGPCLGARVWPVTFNPQDFKVFLTLFYRVENCILEESRFLLS